MTHGKGADRDRYLHSADGASHDSAPRKSQPPHGIGQQVGTPQLGDAGHPEHGGHHEEGPYQPPHVGDANHMAATGAKRIRLVRLTAIIMVVAACGSGTATRSAVTSTTAPGPPTTPTTAGSTVRDVIYHDEFSDRGSGWPERSDASSSTGYSSEGTYLISVRPGGTVVQSVPTSPALANVGNIAVEVVASQRSGPGMVGAVCRAGAGTAGYEFLLDPLGDTWVIVKRTEAGVATELKRGAGGTAVLAPPAPNRMRIDCSTASGAGPGNPPRLVLSVNDVPLGEVVDTTEPFVVGLPGVVAVRAAASSNAQGPLEAAFDDFVVHQKPG